MRGSNLASNVISRSDFDSLFTDSEDSSGNRNVISRSDFDSLFAEDTPVQDPQNQEIPVTPEPRPETISESPPTPLRQEIPSTAPQDEAGIFEGAKQAFTGQDENTLLSRAAPELATGIRLKDQIKDIKDLGVSNFFKIRAQQVFGATPEEIFEVGKKLPGVSGFTDRKGNEFLKFPSGKVFVVNRPGFSQADFNQMATEMGSELLISKGIGKLLPGKSVLVSKLKDFAKNVSGAGVTEVVQGLGRKSTGIDETVDTISKEALVSAGIEAALPGLKLPAKAIQKATRILGGSIKNISEIGKKFGVLPNVLFGKAEPVKGTLLDKAVKPPKVDETFRDFSKPLVSETIEKPKKFKPDTLETVQEKVTEEKFVSDVFQKNKKIIFDRSRDASVQLSKQIDNGDLSVLKANTDFNSAINDTLTKRLKLRKVAADKNFNRAFDTANDKKLVVDINPLLSNIKNDRVAAGLGKKATKAMERILKDPTSSEEAKKEAKELLASSDAKQKFLKKIELSLKKASLNKDKGSNLEPLANAKKAMWFEIDKLKGKGLFKAAAEMEGVVTRYWADLRNGLAKSSPEYKHALEQHISRSKSVESVTELFSSFLNKGEANSPDAITKLFESGTHDLQSLRRMKAVLDKTNKTIFPNLQRAYIAQQAKKIGNVADDVFPEKLFDQLFSKDSLFLKSLPQDTQNNIRPLIKIFKALPSDPKLQTAKEVLSSGYTKKLENLGFNTVDPELSNQIKSEVTLQLLSDVKLVKDLKKLDKLFQGTPKPSFTKKTVEKVATGKDKEVVSKSVFESKEGVKTKTSTKEVKQKRGPFDPSEASGPLKVTEDFKPIADDEGLEPFKIKGDFTPIEEKLLSQIATRMDLVVTKAVDSMINSKIIQGLTVGIENENENE